MSYYMPHYKHHIISHAHCPHTKYQKRSHHPCNPSHMAVFCVRVWWSGWGPSFSLGKRFHASESCKSQLFAQLHQWEEASIKDSLPGRLVWLIRKFACTRFMLHANGCIDAQMGTWWRHRLEFLRNVISVLGANWIFFSSLWGSENGIKHHKETDFLSVWKKEKKYMQYIM